MNLRKYIQAQRFALAVGISTTDTSITLQSFKFPDGTAIASGDIGSINYGTLEPNTTREEQISFTGITTNGDGTVTLTGVTRGLGFGAVDGYAEQSDLKVQHGAGSTFILSNNPAFYNDFVNKYNDETIVGTLTVPTPTAGGHAVTKDYADALVTTTSLAYDRVVIGAVAGESVAEGDLVYFDNTDNEWKKTDADTQATLDNVLLGIAQGAGSNGGAITGGVLIFGRDATNTGLTAGVKIYASNTAGGIAESAGTYSRVIGWSDTAGTLIFAPDVEYMPTSNQKAAMAGGGDFGTPSASNKFVTEDAISNPAYKAPQVVTFTSSGTWTKDAGLKYIVVEVQAGGGGGGGGEDTSSSLDFGGTGGGAGGYAKKLILASALGTTETVTVGSGGTAGLNNGGANGGNGGNSSFGAHATANGGGGGQTANNGLGIGGSASSGDINIPGQSGSYPYSQTDEPFYGGNGGDSFLGKGGRTMVGADAQTGLGFGSGGGGGITDSNQGKNGGAGAPGIVIVTEYYS